MRVIADKMGFFRGSRVRPGEVFDVPEGTTGKWFSPAPAESKAAEAEPKPNLKPKSKKAKDDGPTTFSELAKQDAKDLTPKGSDLV